MLAYDPEYITSWLIDLICEMEVKEKPYKDYRITDNEWIREFEPGMRDSDEYVWHRDKADRTITLLEGSDWYFQFDNELPQLINKYSKIYIPKLKYHRLIPGKEKLRIQIHEKL